MKETWLYFKDTLNMEIVAMIQCPKVETLPEIRINNVTYSNNTYFLPHSNLAHLQAFLKEILELQSKIKLEKYFLQKILEFTGREYSKMKYNNKIYRVINHLEKPFIVKKTLFQNGSSIFNNTSIFSSTFHRNNLKDLISLEDDHCVFKIGSTTSMASIEFLMLLSYLFDKVELGKTSDDTPFRDTFYVFCTDLDVTKKNNLSKFIQNDLKEIINTKTNIYSIFKRCQLFNGQFGVFLYAIRPFIVKIHIITVYYISELRTAIHTDKKIQARVNPIWTVLDTIVTSMNYSIAPFAKELEDQDNPIFLFTS